MQKKSLRIALIQSDRQRSHLGKNLSQTLEILEKLDAVDLVCLPEVWLGVVMYTKKEMAFLLKDLASLAKDKRFTLLTGGLLEKRDGKIFDVCHIIDKDRGVIGEQKKLFPSGAVGERKFMDAGSALTVFPCAGVMCGVLICVDMMYPELVRALALSGAEVVFNPANIPDERTRLWHGLIRTRASENTIFIAYVNNTHTRYFDGRPVMGESLVASPSGDVVIEAGKEGMTLYKSLDLSLVAQQRKRWPYLQDMFALSERPAFLFSVHVIGAQADTNGL
ncbi:MAG: carbon-nitrogen hydrolase family protein [Candidatus Aminicenantes bacterium]|nr:carbon-nitrogen hydrolase family protein [Candidatus Aminicenantes bacterium]